MSRTADDTGPRDLLQELQAWSESVKSVTKPYPISNKLIQAGLSLLAQISIARSSRIGSAG